MARKRCATCSLLKQPLDFPTSTATVCMVCANAPPEPEPEAFDPFTPPTPQTDSAPLFPHVEIDPTNPTHQEMASRFAASKSLLQFIKRFRPKYLAGWVHADICRRLERFFKAVEREESPRMLLCMPVRMGKSEIGSRHFAPWVLGHHPDWEIIAASGGQTLAMTFSRYIRDLMRDPSYKAVFPGTDLDATSQSAENWNTTSGGGYMAAGIGTMIVGRGAHILLIDDPCTSPEAADSQLQRDAVWEWYIGAAINRLAPGGGVLGIMTHWNEDDWAGRVQMLSNMEGGGDVFEVVKYPAINEQGDEYIFSDDTIGQLPPGSDIPEGAKLTRLMGTPLHPERYTTKMLANTKATYYALGNQRWWSALYQQNPAPEDGAYFTKSMFRYYATAPAEHQRSVYQAWDFAITEKAQNDFTVGVTLYQDTTDNTYVADVARFKSDDAFIISDSILDNWVAHGSCALIGFEDGQIWKSVSAVFLRRCEERHLFPSYELLVPLSDKFARAQPLRGRMQGGRVWFDERAPWWEALRQEMLRFGAGGKHDDQVDALAWAVRLSLTRHGPREAQPTRLKSWRDSLHGLGDADVGHMAA